MSLSNFMKKEDILMVEESPKSLKEAIDLSCSLLVQNKKVKAKYPQAIYESHEKLGAYYVVVPKVALPHSRPENGVLKEGVQVTIFKKGADFKSLENGDVFLSIAFASQGAEGHIHLMSEIAKLLENEKIIENIIQKETVEEIWEIIQEN